MNFLNTNIIETASDSLILCMTPNRSLSPSQMKEKTSIIHARNRILKALGQEARKIQDPEQKKLLLSSITKIEDFFLKIGGIEETEIRDLPFFSPLKLIEKPISSSIILSTKSPDNCSEKERLEQEKNRTLKEKIVLRAFEKTSNEEVVKTILECIKLFEGTAPQKNINSFG